MELHERLKQARKAAGYESASAATRAFGWNQSTYIQHENGKRNVPRSKITQYARTFRVSAGWLLSGEGKGPAGSADKRRLRFQEVQIIGAVQAGAWREVMEWDLADQYAEYVPESRRYPGLPRFGLEVAGDSMDQKFDDGWKVICVRFSDLGRSPRDKDYIVCQRVDPSGAIEATLKRLNIREDGAMWLLPESTNPEYLPIRLGALADYGDEIPLRAHVSASPLANGEDVEIVAIVDQFIGDV
ncbi:MAG: LexA family protein [Cognatishimia sp.]|uniref:LexA family protein n=1 Tax=Cognatishimia sp. TaxID=2211648 RepID=UPI004057D38C